MRETTQVARATKNTMTALIGNSLCTLRTEVSRPPPRCNPKTRRNGTPKAIPTQMNRRIRSIRPQGCGCPEGMAFREFGSSAGICGFCSSVEEPGPDASGKGVLLSGRPEYDSRTRVAPAASDHENGRCVVF